MRNLLSLLADNVNPWVFGFFALGALLLIITSLPYLITGKNRMYRSFGTGIALTGLAMFFWAYVSGFRPTDLNTFTLIGVLLFILALAFFFDSYVASIKKKSLRLIYWAIGSIALLIFIVLRFAFYQSNPGFSDDGFFSFNINQIVVYAYVVLVAFSIAPSAYAVASNIKSNFLAGIIRFGFSLVTIGMAILITSTDNYMQVVNGIGMIVGFTVLAISHTLIPLEKK